MNLFGRRFTERGAPPGAVAPVPKYVEPRLSVLAYDEGGLDERVCASLSDLPALAEGHVTWIDVSGLGDGSLVRELGEHFDLHWLATSDVANVGQRPKVEPYDDFLFVVLRMATLLEDGSLEWEQVSLVLGEHWVLTFQETHEDCLEPLRARIRAGRRAIRTGGADYLACMVVDAIVDGYFPVLEFYGERLEDLEERILDSGRSDVLGELYLVKRELSTFRRATWPLRDALNQLGRSEEGLSPSALLHLRDTLDHTMQVVEINESYRELAASLVDVHLSQVGQRTNDVVRVLTVVSTIFIPLTFLAGVYGMNFDRSEPYNMPELGWSLGYPLFWAACVALATVLLLLFRRLGWLRR